MSSKIVELKNPIILKLLNQISDYVLNSEFLLKAADEFPHTDDELDCLSERFLFEHCLNTPITDMNWAEYQNAVNLGTIGDKGILKLMHSLRHYLQLALLDGGAFYPKKAKLSWHHNSNAPGHHLLFSYSIDGNSFFRYYDVETKSIVTVDDPIGWTAKINYFPDHVLGREVFWHCVGTENYRISVGYTIPFTDVNRILELLALDK